MVFTLSLYAYVMSFRPGKLLALGGNSGNIIYDVRRHSAFLDLKLEALTNMASSSLAVSSTLLLAHLTSNLSTSSAPASYCGPWLILAWYVNKLSGGEVWATSQILCGSSFFSKAGMLPTLCIMRCVSRHICRTRDTYKARSLPSLRLWISSPTALGSCSRSPLRGNLSFTPFKQDILCLSQLSLVPFGPSLSS